MIQKIPPILLSTYWPTTEVKLELENPSLDIKSLECIDFYSIGFVPNKGFLIATRTGKPININPKYAAKSNTP
jgi:hypothetical protein